MTAPVELTRRGSDEVLAVACGTCGTLFTKADRDFAEACCLCLRCKLPITTGRRGSEHDACSDARWAEYHRERRDRHTDVTSIVEKTSTLAEVEYTGPVFWDDHGSGEGYFADLGELREWCADHDEALPAWVYACNVVPFGLDAQRVVEDETEECHESVGEAIGAGDIDDLQALLDGWVATLGAPATWEVDHTHAVVLAPEVAP